jgi:hypothetical protein
MRNVNKRNHRQKMAKRKGKQRRSHGCRMIGTTEENCDLEFWEIVWIGDPQLSEV